ncbi:uncharacterized protein LOC131955975 [Physella acuta]|uniref:uncharacterized protein LOC131955975 n=1 Tax=Physella acuta TaxID=109671 RepID=UPI0027DB71DA|nr:uncharacterized protein LOC131955975 [Physella acuta]
MALRIFIFASVVQCLISLINSACLSGWFGPACQYKCHCANNYCDDKGLCVSGSTCVRGWFGPSCQYQDLASKDSIVTPSNAITDGSDQTCADVRSVTVRWGTGVYVGWVRVVLRENASSVNLTLKETPSSADIKCGEQAKYRADSRLVDLFCNMKVKVIQVTLDFGAQKSVCSVYVSGGRNLALKTANLAIQQLFRQFWNLRLVFGRGRGH